MIFVILLLAVFFTINMGGASFAASFAAAYGSKLINRRKAGLLFLTFVILGAVLLGSHVSRTLGRNIVEPSFLNEKALIVIFLAAGLSMFVSNLMRIPQSTSLVTVAAIAGLGAYFNSLNIKTLFFLIPFWILLPILSYVFTYVIAGYVYPPRKKNYWIYERLINQRRKLRNFVIVASCYNAFSVGTNNVANVVGPLVGHSTQNMLLALGVFAILYGLGSFTFNGPLKTAGDQIVPLGLTTASIISLVSGTLMIMASYFGVPQSFVMLQMGALFAVSSLKHGAEPTFKSDVARKTFYTWTINPIITFFVAFGLAWVLMK